MTIVVVPVDAWPADLRSCADGEPVNQAKMLEVQQKYADAATYLKNRLNYGLIKVAAQPALGMTVAGDFAWQMAGRCWKTTINTASTLVLPVPMPLLTPSASGHYPKFSRLSVTTNGANHSGTLAAVPMRVQLTRRDATGTVTQVALKDDDGTTVTIDNIHTWAAVAFSHEIDPASNYVVEVLNESGANAQLNTVIRDISLTCDAAA